MAYRGEEIKFAISLAAEGFSMDRDDFDVEVRSTTRSIKGWKNPPAGEGSLDVIIFKETTGEAPGWYVIADTTTLDVGAMTVIATAYVPDAHANDGVRTLIAKAALGKLEAP